MDLFTVFSKSFKKKIIPQKILEQVEEEKTSFFSKIFGHFRSYFLNCQRKSFETFTKHYKQYLRIFWAYQNYSKSHPFSRTGIERLILKIYDKIVTEHNYD